MADIIDNEELDRDVIEAELIEQQFNKKYKILTENAVSLNKSYINKLHGTKSLKLAIGLTDNNIEVYELNNTSLSRLCRLSGHKNGLSEVVCNPNEDYLVYSAGEDGLVKLWDTRASGTCVQEYKDDEETLTRPYMSMDVSCNGRVMCAGSQLVEDEAYMVFWDPRQTKPLGGYWNSHTDDITQIKFHQTKPEILATGSVDGLLNIFNVLEQTEDDALLYTLNVENTVERLSWMDEKHMTCITQSNDLQVWDVDSGDLIKSFNREKITRSIKRSKADDCYLVDTFMTSRNFPVLLAGSYSGNGDILRSVEITEKKIQPSSNFSQNKQIVRSCFYYKDRDLLVTTGESGIITVWTGDLTSSPGVDIKPTAIAKKSHDSRHKPY